MKKIFFILILFIFTGVANLTYADSKISSIVVAGDSKTVTVNVVAEDSPLSVCVGYKDSFLKPGGICLAHEEKTVPVVDPAVVVSFVLDISKVTTPGEYDVSLKSGKNSKGIGHFTLGQKASTEAWMYFGYFSKSKDFTTKTLCEDDLKQVKSISVDPEKTYLNSALCLQKGSAEYNSKLATWTSAVVINQNQTQKIFKEDYTLLAPLGDTTKIDGTTKVGDYLNTILLIAIGLCGALAVIMIVIYGVQYMGDESVFGKTEAKSHIMAAIMGLLLALGAYTILNTINPNLVGGSLTFNQVDINIESGQDARLLETQARDQKFRKTDYYDDIKKYVNSVDYSSNGYTNKIHHCMAQVAVQRETNGKPELIGHDEDAPYASIPSRVTLIQSGKTKSGAALTPSPISAQNKKLFNDDHIGKWIHTYPMNEAFLGLDWRFSHGIGLMQVTFFPNKYPKYNVGYTTAITKKGMTVKDMLNPSNAIQAGVEHLQFNFKQCDNDVERAYRAYGGGGCDSTNSFSRKEAALRKSLYDQCVAQDK